MNPAPEDFDDLRRLLALKRHEQPPPGYFQNFSSKVIARIEAAEIAAAELPWWRRLLAGLEAGPAMAFSLAVVVGGTFLAGLSMATDPGTHTAVPRNSEPLLAVNPAPSLLTLPELASLPEVASNTMTQPITTLSDEFAPATLFDIRLPQPAQPASFTINPR